MNVNNIINLLGIRVISSNEQSQDQKIKVLNYDYSAFEVYANNIEIPSGTLFRNIPYLSEYVQENYLDNELYETIPIGMTESFLIRTKSSSEDLDVLIDWGDETYTIVKPNEENVIVTEIPAEKEWNYQVTHTYQTTGKYIVKIYGRKYYSFYHNKPAQNLVCRVLEGDLPIATHIHDTASAFRESKRLLSIILNGYDSWYQNAANISNMFWKCTNLVSCIGFRTKNSIYTDGQIFDGCVSLEKTDYQLNTTYTRATSPKYNFRNCKKLNVDINTLIPQDGFFGVVPMQGMFQNCEKLFGTVPADKLWENPNVEWKNTADTFSGCSAEIRAQVPTSWGGTNTEIKTLTDLILELNNSF